MTGSGIQEPFCFVPQDHPGTENVQMAGEEKKENSLFERLKKGLGKTRRSLVTSLDEMIFGEKVIERDLFEELEENLIAADVGAAFTQELIDDMKDIVKRKDLSNPETLRKILRDNVAFILKQREAPLDIPKGGLFTIMAVGVNGTGKTTTIGKMAMGFKARGYSVMLAAADTFRAAAIEQLDVWSQRCGVPMIRQQMGADPSAVVCVLTIRASIMWPSSTFDATSGVSAVFVVYRESPCGSWQSQQNMPPSAVPECSRP
jgi:fused signal recognition particle receptor